MGRLALPIVSAKYLAKIPNRDKVQDIDNAKNFLERNSITTFAQLEKYKTDKGKEFDSREQIFIPKWQRLEQLKELAKAYADYDQNIDLCPGGYTNDRPSDGRGRFPSSIILFDNC